MDWIQQWALLALVIVGALGVGAAIDVFAVGAARRVGLRTGSPAARALALSLRGQPEIWAVIAAVAFFRPFDFLGGSAVLWMNRVVVGGFVLSVTLFLARMSAWLLRGYLARQRQAVAGTIFVNLARIAIWTIGFATMLAALDVQIGPIIASLGVAGLAVSLGLQDTLSNFFSGLQITLSPQFERGHFIRLDTGQEGRIEDVTWRDTTIKTVSNDVLIVPNSILAKSVVTNFTGEEQDHVVWIRVGVDYGSDLDHVERITIEAMKRMLAESEYATPSSETAVRFLEFGPAAIVLQTRAEARRYEDRFIVQSEAIKRLHKAYAEAGIAIPFAAPAAPAAPATSSGTSAPADSRPPAGT